MRKRLHAVALAALLVLSLCWAHVSGHLFWYAGNRAPQVPTGPSLIWHVDECDVGAALDTATAEYGVCVQWNGEPQ